MIDRFFVLFQHETENTSRARSEAFATTHSLAIISDALKLTAGQAAFEFVGDKLVLHLLLDGKLSTLAFDFNDGEVGFRAARVSKSNEVVAKAIGCKPHYRPKVLDATAGMGRDALIMAMLGCEVAMQERNFAIYLLLQNALSRFQLTAEHSQLAGNLSLLQSDSIHSLNGHDDIDVIYLDPMFPERKKSALVKKEMRLFKQLAGDDPDADQLFVQALEVAEKRVVVKRPKGAPVLAGRKPSHEIVAKKFRYDVYLTGR